MDLSELIDEIREIAIYGTNPEDWMGYVECDNVLECSNIDQMEYEFRI